MPDAERRENACLGYMLDIIAERDFGAPFEALLASWWGYREAIRRDVTAPVSCWLSIRRAPELRGVLDGVHYLSAGAAACLARGERLPLVHDEMVPARVLRRMLFEDSPAGVMELRAFLTAWYRLALITGDDAAHLAELGLIRRMPDDEADGSHLLARYNRAGISLQQLSALPAIVTRSEATTHADPDLPGGISRLLSRLRYSSAPSAVRQ